MVPPRANNDAAATPHASSPTSHSLAPRPQSHALRQGLRAAPRNRLESFAATGSSHHARRLRRARLVDHHRLKRVSPKERLASGLKVDMELVRPSYTNMSFSYLSAHVRGPVCEVSR
ncbi:hypothetical protein WA556_004727 [Blastocystis sp. ATCC 50177/Nand II]